MSPSDALAQISRETGKSVQVLQAVPTNTVQGQMIANRLAQLTKGPGLLTKYGPLAAVGLGTLAATGGFKAEQPEVPPGFEDMAAGISPGQRLLEQDPARYGLNFGGVRTTSASAYNPYLTQPFTQPYGAAKGGSTSDFPRKNGHISGPGTGTSDDIPAMLSDGEFVFTAKAVRNMGDGSRRKGAKRMYALMKKLEGRA
jgi:hypothetical protein